MATKPEATLTYADLEAFPEDNLRRELIDGELIVTAAPAIRHQRVVTSLVAELHSWTKRNGGVVLPAPTDVFFSDISVVEPDVVFVRADHLDKIEKKFIRSAPDVVVEVSSPTTRRLEVVRKRDLYERFGVPEYWYVDLEVDRIEVYRLEKGRYGLPRLYGRGDTLSSSAVRGLSLPVDEIIGPSEDDSE